jgi:hypothetical protein
MTAGNPLLPSSQAALRPPGPLRTGRERLPSSQAALRPPSPLRTVRESFQSHSSGPANASLEETRFRYGNTLAVNHVVAFRVK